MWLLPSGRHDRAGQMRSLDAAKAFADGVGWYEDTSMRKRGRRFVRPSNWTRGTH